jgi:hypothetical protein
MDNLHTASDSKPVLDHLDPLSAGSVAQVLAALHEPLELEAPSGGPAFRLFSLPAFRGATLLRIDRGDAGWQITGKMTAWPYRSMPTLAWSRQRVLRRREAAQVDRLIAQLNLWTLPVTDNVVGFDGETWLLEGKEHGRHHVIERWCPDYRWRLPALATFGVYLTMLARVPANRPPPAHPAEQRRERLERLRELRRAAAERERLHLEEMSRRNDLARRLAVELETRGLTCPHCQRHARDVRFVHGRLDAEWYFICRSCGRSFTARDRLAIA